MSKKLIFYILMLCCSFCLNVTKAQEYGNVYLDLKEDEEELPRIQDGGVIKFWEYANYYIEDVKEYDELLEGKSINKDFSDDFKNKYKSFNDVKSQEWEKYVRTGVKAYRWYKDAKKYVTEWVMEKDIPLVFDDSQYEMGGEEEYIKSDNPVVIEDFKKVVAYSGQQKDVLAAKEKYAKEHNLETPSERSAKYKNFIIKKDWKGLFSSLWDELKGNIDDIPEIKVSGKINRIKTVILPKYQYTDDKGNIQAVIVAELSDDNIFLYNGYKDNKAVEINFDKSENLKDVDIKFIYPQQIEIKKGENLLVYSGKFPIYFTAKVEDTTKDVAIKPVIKASVCKGYDCELVSLEPVLKLKPKEANAETVYSSHVTMVSMNVPNDIYKDKYKFGELIFEKKNDGNLGSLRLDVKTSDTTGLDVFIIGDEAKYFSRQRFSINGNVVTVRFDLEDMTFNPLGKEISFWVSTNKAKNYIFKQTVKDMSVFDVQSGMMSLGVLGFAFLGGFLLNLMPCVFPVLSLKLLNYTKFSKLKAAQIRNNFILNVAGILVCFFVIGTVLCLLKIFGQAIGWGMQFQNTYFLVSVLWLVVFFLCYIFGIFSFKNVDADRKIARYKGSKLFEFLSGIFLVLLSTPCMAPYLGTAFGIALAGDVKSIILTVMVVGLGLATPYILIAIFPKVAIYMPKPGKWMTLINAFMILLLVVTVVWLMSILAVQTNINQVWHWIIYAIVMISVLSFWRVVKRQINLVVKDKEENIKLHKKFSCIFYFVILVIVAISFVDTGYATKNRQDYVKENYATKLDLSAIEGLVNNGNQVLVKVGADWCLTCKYNDMITFDIEYIKDEFENNGVFVIEVDWTEYQPQVLRFMQKFGRSGLPFYVLFSKKYPDGLVLSEIVNDYDLMSLIE
ncbi:MAG: thioredoxin family protein [Alphaproteobacteria bacterium]|nr:thioredoxin family protein [Alphaproteobacteria bacterium]